MKEKITNTKNMKLKYRLVRHLCIYVFYVFTTISTSRPKLICVPVQDRREGSTWVTCGSGTRSCRVCPLSRPASPCWCPSSRLCHTGRCPLWRPPLPSPTETHHHHSDLQSCCFAKSGPANQRTAYSHTLIQHSEHSLALSCPSLTSLSLPPQWRTHAR